MSNNKARLKKIEAKVLPNKNDVWVIMPESMEGEKCVSTPYGTKITLKEFRTLNINFDDKIDPFSTKIEIEFV